MNKLFRIFALTVCVALLLCGCAKAPEAPAVQDTPAPKQWVRIVENSPFALGEDDYGTYPAIDGSFHCLDLARELAWQHLGLSEDELSAFVNMSGKMTAYETMAIGEPSGNLVPLEDGRVLETPATQLILSTTPTKNLELTLGALNGMAYGWEEIGWDAIVFVTHPDTPVDNLTVEQLRGIYSGQIKRWNGLGGKGKIAAYQQDVYSEEYQQMYELVMDGQEPIEATTQKKTMNGMTVEITSTYTNEPGAIGYMFLRDALRNDKVKILSVNGVVPSAETVRDGSYPLATAIVAAIDAKLVETPEAAPAQFLAWLCSEEGQRCVEQAGYIRK